MQHHVATRAPSSQGFFVAFVAPRCFFLSVSNTHHLADAIGAILSRHHLSAREMAAAAGISHSIISRLRDQRIDTSSLQKLVAWCPTIPERDQVVLAHLWDEVTRLGLDPAPFWDSIADEDSRWFASLPPKVQAALRGLGDSAVGDPAFIDLLDGMAERRLRASAVKFDASYSQPEQPQAIAAEEPSKPTRARYAQAQPNDPDPVKRAVARELQRRAARRNPTLPSAPQNSPSATPRGG